MLTRIYSSEWGHLRKRKRSIWTENTGCSPRELESDPALVRAIADKCSVGLPVGPFAHSEAINAGTVNTDDSIHRLTHESLRCFILQSCAPA
jgi:hypothetical protein